MTDEDKSHERKHGGHHLVQMATMRYDTLLNMDRAQEWKLPHLVTKLEQVLDEINRAMLAELDR